MKRHLITGTVWLGVFAVAIAAISHAKISNPPTTSGFMVGSNNLSELTAASTARTNLGLGSIATQSASDYLASSTPYLSSSSYPMTFVIENPTAAEDDYLFTARATTTINRVYVVNKSVGDTVTFNIAHATSRTQATSTSNRLFAAYTAVTATTTASCYAAATTSVCATGVFGTNASTTIGAGATVRFSTTAASSSQAGITLWVTEN